jgi:hypothetical protein
LHVLNVRTQCSARAIAVWLDKVDPGAEHRLKGFRLGILAGVAIIVYTVALPRRYDIACGAFAFTLIVTLEMSGQHSAALLLSRVWETMLGATLGVAMALLIGWSAAALFPRSGRPGKGLVPERKPGVD